MSRNTKNSRGPIAFGVRLRELAQKRGLSFADLAKRAELDPSVVSRLAAEAADARRPPKIEHLLGLACAFDMLPADLVAGTDAVEELGAWVPRSELERQIEGRLTAEEASARARTEIAAMNGELDVLRRQLADLEVARATADQRASKAELAVASAEAKAAGAQTERDHALAKAERIEKALADTHVKLASAMEQLKTSKKNEGRNAALGIMGTLAAGLIGAAVAAPDKPKKRKRRA